MPVIILGKNMDGAFSALFHTSSSPALTLGRSENFTEISLNPMSEYTPWFQWAPLMMTVMILRIKWGWIVTYYMLHWEVINIMWHARHYSGKTHGRLSVV